MDLPPKHDEDELASRQRVAHELNDALTVIAGYAELSRELGTPGSPLAGYQAEILSAVERASRLAVALAARIRAQTAPEPARASTAPMSETPRWGQGRVLLVDDDPGVRKFTSAILTLNGLEVTAVASGEEALALCRAPDSEFGLVISDIRMSPIDGLELAACLGEMRPSVPILLMSGYPGVTTEPVDRNGRRIPFMSKPYTNFQLLAHVRRLMGRDNPVPIPLAL